MALQKKSLELLAQVQKIIEDYDFALTVRQIYYQLVAKQFMSNSQNSYRKAVRICKSGRDEGALPEEAFTDRLREVDKPNSWNDLTAFMNTVRQAYRKDPWRDNNSYLEIWSEKDALREVITAITYAYDVSLLIVRGHVSRTAIYETYKRFEQKIDEGKECYLYYFGDFDPSGLAIYDSLVDRISSYGPLGQYIKFERVALTPEQVAVYNLPYDPAKKADPNSKKFIAEYGDNVVELDSLPPEVLRGLIKACIELNIDEDILAQVQETEEREQARLQEIINQTGI
jgi:hypothetical protein